MRYAFKTPESPKDSRTVKHEDTTTITTPLVKGGYQYLPTDIENQFNVGICTAISMVQNQEKANGKKYSADFHYLMEKRQDGNWDEGSSLLTSCKVANKIGFLPVNLWTFTTDADREGTYANYIAKLQAIPEATVQSLIAQCVDKIPGYASVDITDSQAMAKAITDSKAGILCRYTVGNEWWTDIYGNYTFDPARLNPIRPPQNPIDGHAIGMPYFDYTVNISQSLCNTWGTEWNNQGVGYTYWINYRPTEAWVILNQAPILPPFSFQHDLQFGMTSPDIQRLQQVLNRNHATQVALTGVGSLGQETQYFGGLTFQAVKKFQTLNNLPSTGFCGPLTRAVLNKLLVVLPV